MPKSAHADAWWGEGYRDEYWVRRHGGTIIKYEIKGKKNSDSYKVRMYLLGEFGAGGHARNEAEKGDIIETEYGGKGVIDDAINNTYKLIVYKGSSKKADTTLKARPGKELFVLFDLDDGDAKVSVTKRLVSSEISLDSHSSKYVSAADLGRTYVSSSTGETYRLPASTSSIQQKEKQNAQELRIFKETYKIKLQEENQEIKEQLYLIETLFHENQQKISNEISKLEEMNSLHYWIKGPDKKNMFSLEKVTQSNKNNIAHLRKLQREAPTQKIKDEIKEKISFLESSLKKSSEQIQNKKADASFWTRTKNLFI